MFCHQWKKCLCWPLQDNLVRWNILWSCGLVLKCSQSIDSTWMVLGLWGSFPAWLFSGSFAKMSQTNRQTDSLNRVELLPCEHNCTGDRCLCMSSRTHTHTHTQTPRSNDREHPAFKHLPSPVQTAECQTPQEADFHQAAVFVLQAVASPCFTSCQLSSGPDKRLSCRWLMEEQQGQKFSEFHFWPR